MGGVREKWVGLTKREEDNLLLQGLTHFMYNYYVTTQIFNLI